MTRNTQPIAPPEPPPAPPVGIIANLKRDLEELKAMFHAKAEEVDTLKAEATAKVDELEARVNSQATVIEKHAASLAEHAEAINTVAAHFDGL